MRGQLGDAPGFGEMQGIFAQAYQQSLGRTGDQALKGQKAIEALNAAMEKGQVISAKILPYVAEIAKQMAAGGIDEARLSSFAEQNRFQNQMAMGWKAFREGGGESGLAFFWRIMQRMGTWWETNGAALGKGFETFIYWLDVVRLGVGEFFSFMSNGQHNSFSKWLGDMGVDIAAWRESILQLKDAIFKLLNLDQSGQGLTELSNRLITFTDSLRQIVDNVTLIVDGLNKVTTSKPVGMTNKEVQDIYTGVKNGVSPIETIRMQQDARFNTSIWQGIKDVFNGISGGTSAATSGLQGLAVGGNAPTPLGIRIDPLRTDYGRDWGTTPSSVLSPTTSAMSAQRQTLDVNLNVTGNPEVINQLIDQRSRESFPLLLSSEIAKSVTSAAKNQ